MSQTAVEPKAATKRQPRRADAQRNYDRILLAARAAVAERGGEIVLEDVAREAGVGIGTLYRHFPTRQALLSAAFLDEAEELRDRAEELAGAPSSFEALRTWLRLQLVFGSHGHAMGAAVMSAKHTEGSEIQQACVAMKAAGQVLLDRAQTDGTVRPEVQMTDLLRLMHGIVLANEQALEPERAAGMFDLVIAGIRS